MRRGWQSLSAVLWVFYVVLTMYMVVGLWLSLPAARLAMPLTTLFFFAFSLTHAVLHVGRRNAVLLLGLTFGVSLLFESVGVLTGWVYGPYHYTDRLGVKFLGLVPLLIPVAWFMMSYPSLVVAGSLVSEGTGSSLRRSAGVAFLSAMIMTAWDLGMDPVMVATDHWVWEVKGAYFGIPVQNYVGWLATTFCIFFPYRLVAARHERHPSRSGWRSFDSLPALAYAVTWVSTTLVNAAMGQTGVALVSFFAMGSFALLGLARLRPWRAPT